MQTALHESNRVAVRLHSTVNVESDLEATASSKLLHYLLNHPDWHSSWDLLKVALTSPVMLFWSLTRLQDRGYVEERTDPQVLAARHWPSPQYRVARKALEERFRRALTSDD
jgi:hypothetical protein